MELGDVYTTLAKAVMILSSRNITFVETPTDKDGNELEHEKTPMRLSTFILRAFGEQLLEDGTSEEEIRTALGQMYDDEVAPTGNPYHIIMNGGGARRKTPRRRRNNTTRRSIK